MPDILTATLALTALTACRSASRTTSAMSAEGKFTTTRITEVWNGFESAFSLQAPHANTLSALENLAAEHSLPGWDGAEAPPISYLTLENAKEFASALPASVAAPELAVDPDDAAISFEWHGGYRRVFSVSIGDAGRLSCAGLDGIDQWYAVLRFEGVIPQLVTDSAIRVMS
jgi:hypothetical protein